MNASDRIRHLYMTGVELCESARDYDEECAQLWESQSQSCLKDHNAEMEASGWDNAPMEMEDGCVNDYFPEDYGDIYEF